MPTEATVFQASVAGGCREITDPYNLCQGFLAWYKAETFLSLRKFALALNTFQQSRKHYYGWSVFLYVYTQSYSPCVSYETHNMWNACLFSADTGGGEGGGYAKMAAAETCL